MDDSGILPVWAPRVKQKEIRRLYDADARGIYDEDLIDEVGYGLLVRCESFIDANEARAGRARCPSCSSIVEHDHRIVHCDCGWELPWDEYFSTIQHAQLSGAEPVIRLFRAFVREFPLARTPQKKMLAIDRLIHGFHVFYRKTSHDEDPRGEPTRPVAVNLIEGSLDDVVAFLDQLTYGDESTPGTRENYYQWTDKVEVHRDWYRFRQKGKVRSGNEPDRKQLYDLLQVVPDVVGMGMKPEELIQGFSRWVRDRSDIAGFRRPGSFDIACSVLTFMHVAEKKAALQNIVDSLRTGGYVVLSIDHGSDSLDFGDWSVDLYSWPPERYADVLAGMGCEVSESIHLIDSWVGPDGQRSETHGEPIATVIKAIKPR